MENIARKLWSGGILIQQDSLPGLSQEEEILVDIFQEESSKRTQENFDWTSNLTKVAKFWRFPKWVLKNNINLLPFIKDSCIVKVMSLPESQDHAKFARLVECLAKSGKEAFCGFLRVDEGHLRPLCLMVTEKGLLGFCVDFPFQADEMLENLTSLYSSFEKTLKENFAAGKNKVKMVSKVKGEPQDINLVIPTSTAVTTSNLQEEITTLTALACSNPQEEITSSTAVNSFIQEVITTATAEIISNKKEEITTSITVSSSNLPEDNVMSTADKCSSPQEDLTNSTEEISYNPQEVMTTSSLDTSYSLQENVTTSTETSFNLQENITMYTVEKNSSLMEDITTSEVETISNAMEDNIASTAAQTSSNPHEYITGSAAETSPNPQEDITTNTAETSSKRQEDIYTSSADTSSKPQEDITNSIAAETSSNLQEDIATSAAETSPNHQEDVTTNTAETSSKRQEDITTSVAETSPKPQEDITTSSGAEMTFNPQEYITINIAETSSNLHVISAVNVIHESTKTKSETGQWESLKVMDNEISGHSALDIDGGHFALDIDCGHSALDIDGEHSALDIDASSDQQEFSVVENNLALTVVASSASLENLQFEIDTGESSKDDDRLEDGSSSLVTVDAAGSELQIVSAVDSETMKSVIKESGITIVSQDIYNGAAKTCLKEVTTTMGGEDLEAQNEPSTAGVISHGLSLQTEDSRHLSNYSSAEVTSPLFNPSITEKTSQSPGIEQSTETSPSDPVLNYPCSAPVSHETEQSSTPIIVDGKDPKYLKIYAETDHDGATILHPVHIHEDVSATNASFHQKKEKAEPVVARWKPRPRIAHTQTVDKAENPGVTTVARCLNKMNVMEEARKKPINVRPAIDLGKVEKAKEFFVRRFDGCSRMKETKKVFLQYINKELGSEEFLKTSKIVVHSQVGSATSFLSDNFPHLRERILMGKVKLSELHWMFKDTFVDNYNLVVSNTEVVKKVKDEKEKLSKKNQPSSLPVINNIPMLYKGHGDCQLLGKEYVSIFTEHRILFCHKNTRLPLQLVQNFALPNKVWSGATEGKVYLPDMFFPTKQNEVHFFVIQDSRGFEQKLLNLGNLQESSTLITKDNFLKFSSALMERFPGMEMTWKMRNPTEELLLFSNGISVFLSEVNAKTTSQHETIDLYHDAVDRLIDVPGIDEEIAADIIKARVHSKSLVNFIQKDHFGFKVLVEIQNDVGLLARRFLLLNYNGTPLRPRHLQIMEENVFQDKFLEWRRPADVPCIIMIAVLGILTGKQALKVEELKSIMENQIRYERAVEIPWVKFASIVLSFIDERKLSQSKFHFFSSSPEFRIASDSPKKISPPSKLFKSKELASKKKKSIPTVKLLPSSDLLATILKLPSVSDNNNTAVITKTEIKEQASPQQISIPQIKSVDGIEAESESRTELSNGSPASPVVSKLTPFPTVSSLPQSSFGRIDNVQICKETPSDLQMQVSSTTPLSSNLVAKYSAFSLPPIGKTIPRVDEKLFLKSSVVVEKLSTTEIRKYAGIDGLEEPNNNVTLEEAFANYLLYAEVVSEPVENLLPSAEAKLAELKNKRSEALKAVFECRMCNTVLVSHASRHQHYLSAHSGPGIAGTLVERQFECTLCGNTFCKWEERHEHYLTVHCK